MARKIGANHVELAVFRLPDHQVRLCPALKSANLGRVGQIEAIEIEVETAQFLAGDQVLDLFAVEFIVFLAHGLNDDVHQFPGSPALRESSATRRRRRGCRRSLPRPSASSAASNVQLSGYWN